MGLKGPEWTKRVDEMLNLVGLGEYKRIYPHEMSGGMRQRTGIARALVHDPKVLIMDQPFGALDAITRKLLAFELFNIWKTMQKTVLFVTNNIEEALLLSSRVFILSPKPSTIILEYAVDIPLSDRTPKMFENLAYQKMLKEVNSVVKNTNLREDLA
jgi:NitT/TauT family transport system ATP-binding protein